jgi:glycosyltransferase involved in cell wall biosynthesis
MWAQNVLIVTGDFVRTGGMDKANFYLADYLARRGVAVHLISHRVDPALLDYPNVTFHCARLPLKSYFLGGFFLSRLGTRVARDLGKGAIAIVNGGNCPLPAVNWVHYVHAAADSRMPGPFLRRLKGVFSHRLFLHDEKVALGRARIIIANSKRTKEDLVTRLGILPDKIHIVYYGADAIHGQPPDAREKETLRDRLGFSREKILFTFIGGLSDRRKGFDLLFEAWQTLPPEMRATAELLVIGAGAEIPAWKARALEAGIGDSIRFLGFRRDVPDILRAADALVSPTRYDSFGLAVLEALCAGLPAIVSQHAGVAERYPASLRELLLSDPQNRAELVEKLMLVHKESARLVHTVQLSIENLIEYSWTEMGECIMSVIQGSVREHPGEAPRR